jgi:hypothetical protein
MTKKLIVAFLALVLLPAFALADGFQSAGGSGATSEAELESDLTDVADVLTDNDAIGLPYILANDKTDATLTSQAAALKLGSDWTSGSEDGWYIYVDPTNGPMIECISAGADCDNQQRIPTNKVFQVYDVEGARNVLDIDPDATNATDYFKFYTVFRPKKVPEVPMEVLTGATRAAAQISTGPNGQFVTFSDNDTDAAEGSMPLSNAYADGTTVDVCLWGHNSNASPSGVLAFDAAALCRSPGDTNVTWGTEVALDVDMSSSCGGGACAQNEEFFECATVTPAGSCIGGDRLYIKIHTDATRTTSTQLTTTQVVDRFTVKVLYDGLGD